MCSIPGISYYVHYLVWGYKVYFSKLIFGGLEKYKGMRRAGRGVLGLSNVVSFCS